jgi:hypothetical protein
MPLPDITRSLPATARSAVTQRVTTPEQTPVTGARPRPARRGRAIAGVTAAAVTAAVLAAAPAVAAAPRPPLRYHTFNVPGSTATEVIGINDKGVFTGVYVPQGHPNVVAGYIDARGRITSFTYPAPAYYTHSVAINNQGTAVGFSQHGHGPVQGWLRSPSGTFTPINDPLAGTGNNQGTEAQSVNDHSVVAGVYITSGDVSHGFVYRSGHFTTVDVPRGFYGKPYRGSGIFGINNAGVMVGAYNPSRTNVTLGYAETPGQFTSITGPGAGTQPGDATYANAISNTGVIAGTSNGPSGVSHGWVLAGCAFTLLHDPHAAGAFGAAPEGINRHGVVVGIYLDARGYPHVHGFLVATGITGAAPHSPCPPAAPVRPGGVTRVTPAYRLALPAR